MKSVDFPLTRLKYIPNNSSVLDIGANKKRFKEYLKEKNIEYYSMDIDKSNKHNFYSINSATKRKYDTIVMFQVMEHLDPNMSIAYLKKIKKTTDKLIITIPNVFAPSWVYFQDITHKTQYSYETISAFLKIGGFNKIKIIRLSPTKNPITVFIKKIFSRITGIDFCYSIFVLAEK